MSEEKIDGRSREARAMREQSLSTVEEGRPARNPHRKPFGSQIQKLAYPPREGYHRHWFNDEPGRISQAKENGYNHVLDQATNKPLSRVVNSGGMQAYLMEIPREWFEDDMAAQQQAVDDRENTIRRGQVDASDPRDRDGRFTNKAQGRKIDIRSTMARR
jgi:uncharacterized protein with von Willebrand factor type A (vWA) domain